MQAAPRSNYFEKPPIDIADDDVVLICCLKNEAKRIPYFLEYYKNLGVKHFLIIDNASTDGSAALLKNRPGIHYFFTDMSYKGSSAGRLWMQELADHYGANKWCLTVDVDELLVYPGVEHMSLPEFCAYLDIEGSQGLFCTFLDLYSDRPLSQTIYTPGQPFTDVCCYFDADSYILTPGANPPFVSIFGGPRGKTFLAEGKNGPMMKKVPLVKWSEGFTYIFSTHSHSHLMLSRLTGAVLHFKFFEFFTDLVAYEKERGDRRQTSDYVHYAETFIDNTCFHTKQSYSYSESADLIRLGILRSNNDLRDYCLNLRPARGPADETLVRRAFPNAQANPPLHPSGVPTIRWLDKLWPLLNNRAAPEYYSEGIFGPAYADRARFVELARKEIKIIDVFRDRLLVSLPESVIYRHNSPRLSLLIAVGGRVIHRQPIRFDNDAVSVDTGSLEARIFKFALGTAFTGQERSILNNVRMYVVPDEFLLDFTVPSDLKVASERTFGEPIFSSDSVLLNTTQPSADLAASRMNGVIESFSNGSIIGWIFNLSGERRFDHPIAVYMNGRFAGLCAAPAAKGSGKDGLERFKFDLPLGYFFERKEFEIKLEVRAAGRNVSLRRSPAQITGGKDYRWVEERSKWVEIFN